MKNIKKIKNIGCGCVIFFVFAVAGLKRQIASGAPTNPDGTIDLVDYAAWLCYCSKRE